MQQFFFIAGLAAIILGLYSLFKLKNIQAIISILTGILLVGSAYLTVFMNDQPNEAPKKEIKIRLSGSKTIGQSLMPNLIKEYLSVNGFKVFSQNESQDKILISASKKTDAGIEILHFELYSTGSIKGFDLLKNGGCDIAMSSNPLPKEIAEALGAGYLSERNELILAFDALRLIGHLSFSKDLKSMSIQMLEEILQGKVQKWSKLNNKKQGDITICLRDTNSGTYRFIDEHFLAHQLPDSTIKSAKIEHFDYYEKIAKRVSEDSLTLGLIDFGIDSLMLQNIYTIPLTLKDSKFIFPDENTIRSRTYPLSRPLFLYTSGNIDKQEYIKSLLKFCQSPQAAEIIRKERFIPR